MIWENIKMAGRSIAANKLRTFLTMLGIIIGVGAVVAISSIGQGLKGQVGQQVSDLGANIIFVTPGQILGGKDGKGSFNPGSSIGASTLTQADIQTIKTIPGVSDETFLSILSGIANHNGAQDTNALLIATTADYTKVIQNQKIDNGRFLSEADTDANVVVLGSAARDSLFGPGSPAIGKSITVRNAAFTVIGVMRSSNNGSSLGGPSFDDAIYLPAGSAKALTGSELSINRIAIKADSSADVGPTVDRIKAALHKNHGGQDDFSVLTQKDLLGAVDTILNALTGAIAAIASISLLVGGIGIMNMMLVSVTERTREIGLRKAIGATSRMVLGQFLIEALCLSLLGGILGVGLAFVGATAAGKLIKIAPSFTPSTILTAFVISLLVGVVFGIAPAIKAARMKPIDALRYE